MCMFVLLKHRLVDVKDCLQEDTPILVVAIDRTKLPQPLHFREFTHTVYKKAFLFL
jgi:hypothetical protein